MNLPLSTAASLICDAWVDFLLAGLDLPMSIEARTMCLTSVDRFALGNAVSTGLAERNLARQS